MSVLNYVGPVGLWVPWMMWVVIKKNMSPIGPIGPIGPICPVCPVGPCRSRGSLVGAASPVWVLYVLWVHVGGYKACMP